MILKRGWTLTSIHLLPPHSFTTTTTTNSSRVCSHTFWRRWEGFNPEWMLKIAVVEKRLYTWKNLYFLISVQLSTLLGTGLQSESQKGFLFYYNSFIFKWCSSSELTVLKSEVIFPPILDASYKYIWNLDFFQCPSELNFRSFYSHTHTNSHCAHTHTQASLFFFSPPTCFCICESQHIFKNKLGSYSEDGLDGWMLIQSIHP